MRTKTLLLTAALSVAGMATSMAQVYSVNAVGYVNTTLVPGFSLVSNPLKATDNTIGALFKNITPGPIPNNLTVYDYNGSTFEFASWDDIDEKFNGDAADNVLNPGEGVFVLNPSSAALTVTFVGEVPQGNLSHALPKGLSIQSSEVPQAGPVSGANGLGLVGEQGDTIYKFIETNTEAAGKAQKYAVYSYDDIENNWLNENGQVEVPSMGVGEAFFLLKGRAAGTWSRTFSVNPTTP